MPYQCLTCKTPAATEEAVQCKDASTKCAVRKVQTIHLLHPEGQGRLLAKGTRKETIDGEDIKETISLNLCCDSNKQSPIATRYRPAATCLACLANMPAPEPEPEDE